MGIIETILVAIIEHVGLPLVMKVIAARTSQTSAEYELGVAYDLLRAASDAEAKTILGSGK